MRKTVGLAISWSRIVNWRWLEPAEVHTKYHREKEKLYSS